LVEGARRAQASRAAGIAPRGSRATIDAAERWARRHAAFQVARRIAAADELAPPSFAAYLFTAC